MSQELTEKQIVGARPVADTDSIIRLNTVLARTELSRSALYRKISKGTFPRQTKISVRSAGWHERDVGRWIADPASYRASGDPSAMRHAVSAGARRT